jgi:hypothetical protein
MTLTIILIHVGLLKVLPPASILKQKISTFIFAGTVNTNNNKNKCFIFE